MARSLRLAVPPPRRLRATRRPSVDEVIARHRPWEPVHCLRPRVLEAQARRFVALFPGVVLYAVKANPDPGVLRALHRGGVRNFDVASPGEVRLLRRLLPRARLHYMHPVKPRAAIAKAYGAHGVRDFALDCAAELDKILTETGHADDLGLFVRLALPKGRAVYDLSGKFGAPPEEAALLLRACRRVAPRVGLCFHVGSQCLDPGAYEAALELCGAALRRAGVAIDVLDVGGGFPVPYADDDPPPLEDFIAAIGRGVARLDLPAHCRLWAEPGRNLAAPGVSVVAQVLLRRGSALHISDGVYGSLADAGSAGVRFPVRLIRPDGFAEAPPQPFSLFGPTCDSADRMAGPFHLPGDVREGDWIEFGQLGAYGATLRTAFNGFEAAYAVEVRDPPLVLPQAPAVAGAAGARAFAKRPVAR